jgi:hypothetical protein
MHPEARDAQRSAALLWAEVGENRAAGGSNTRHPTSMESLVCLSLLAKARNAKTHLQSHQCADSHQTITCEVIAAILDPSDSKAVAEQDFL